MQEMIMGIMNDWGYIGVFLMIAAETIFPPIPSEVILIFGGALTAPALGGKLHMTGMVIAATIGAVLGAIVLYYIGKILKAERLKKIIDGKIGKILRVKPKDVDKADEWFRTKGSISVLICRCIPVVRSLISIPAGMSEMKMSRFLLYTTIGSLIWNIVLVIIGHNLGDNWQSVLGFFDRYQSIVLIICVVIFVAVLVWWFGFYSKKKTKRAHNIESKTGDSEDV